ncbi:MAG: hypothetical protein JJT78_02775 [Leptospira sp.]|nr:hypothetical protein [Leptospira sp.]
MISLSQLIPALRSELLKIYFLKIPHRIFFINILILAFLVSTSLKFSSSQAGSYSMETHKSILNIHLFFSRFVFLFITSVTICSNFGKEFEWKTIHQFLIKGLNSSNMILSKVISYWIVFVAEYLAYTLLVLLGYFLFSPENMRDTFYSVSWLEVLVVPLGIFLSVSISVLAVSLSFSSSRALIFNFLYFMIVELVLRGFLSLVHMISPNPVLDKATDYFPYKSYVAISGENPDVLFFILSAFAFSVIFIATSLAVLRKKEFALINT